MMFFVKKVWFLHKIMLRSIKKHPFLSVFGRFLYAICLFWIEWYSPNPARRPPFDLPAEKGNHRKCINVKKYWILRKRACIQYFEQPKPYPCLKIIHLSPTTQECPDTYLCTNSWGYTISKTVLLHIYCKYISNHTLLFVILRNCAFKLHYREPPKPLFYL